MLNPKEIEIAQIKKLNLIYFYQLDSNHIGLRIVYDNNNKKLDYNYTYEYFDLFVAKVVKVYREEKQKHNIIFLDDKSKEIMDAFCNENIDVASDSVCVQDRDRKYLNRNLDVKFLDEYILRTVSLFLGCMENDENISVRMVRRYRDGYSFIYNSNKVLPFRLTKQDDFSYLISFRYANNDTSISFSGEINIYTDCIAINYHSNDNIIEGKNIYNTDIEKNIEEIKYNGVVVSYTDIDNQFLDNQTIDFYLNLLGLPSIEKKIKTAGNNYLLVGDVSEHEKYFIHISLSKDYVNVIVNRGIGTQKDDLFVLFEQERYSVNLMLEKNNLVIEHHYFDTAISTGCYKKNFANKYSYQVYQIDSDDLTKPFNLCNNSSKKL